MKRIKINKQTNASYCENGGRVSNKEKIYIENPVLLSRNGTTNKPEWQTKKTKWSKNIPISVDLTRKINSMSQPAWWRLNKKEKKKKDKPCIKKQKNVKFMKYYMYFFIFIFILLRKKNHDHSLAPKTTFCHESWGYRKGSINPPPKKTRNGKKASVSHPMFKNILHIQTILEQIRFKKMNKVRNLYCRWFYASSIGNCHFQKAVRDSCRKRVFALPTTSLCSCQPINSYLLVYIYLSF